MVRSRTARSSKPMACSEEAATAAVWWSWARRAATVSAPVRLSTMRWPRAASACRAAR